MSPIMHYTLSHCALRYQRVKYGPRGLFIIFHIELRILNSFRISSTLTPFSGHVDAPSVCVCMLKTQISDFPCNVCATSGITASVGEFSFVDFGIR